METADRRSQRLASILAAIGGYADQHAALKLQHAIGAPTSQARGYLGLASTAPLAVAADLAEERGLTILAQAIRGAARSTTT
jgi:hypothetical protein